MHGKMKSDRVTIWMQAEERSSMTDRKREIENERGSMRVGGHWTSIKVNVGILSSRERSVCWNKTK